MLSEAGVAERIVEIRKELESESLDVLQEYPIQAYLGSIRDQRDCPGLCSVVRESGERIEGKYGRRIHAGYQKLALAMLIGGSLVTMKNDDMTRSVYEFCSDRFERIVTRLAEKPDHYFDRDNGAFLDDMCCCSLQSVPIGGAWRIEVSAVRKKHLVGGGIRQAFSFLFFILFKMGGLRPVYRIHTLRRHSGGFTPEERINCFLRIAELLKKRREVKGIYVLGWLYDPKLADVSPQLAYLREVPERNGARLFRFGTTEEGIRLATAFSPERKELFRQGKYAPTDYALVWPRREMLRWAMERTKDDKTDS